MEIFQRPLVASITPANSDGLHKVAIAYEANFLSEMIGDAGLGQAGNNLGSGVGGDAFASLLNDQYSLQLAENGGIGLADQIFAALLKASIK